MPTPEEIVKSLREDGILALPHTVHVDSRATSWQCCVCLYMFQDVPSLKVREVPAGDSLTLCLDRPKCRTHGRKARGGERLDRLKGLEAVKL